MTEIQKNIAVANFIIDELHKDKPFVLKLDKSNSEAFWQIVEETPMYELRLPVIQNGLCSKVTVNKGNADQIYHMLSSYIAKHSLPKSILESLKEVS